jgi:hypothetical protein
MSHIHNVAGQSNAAAEYQAYLQALKAARQARENDQAQRGGVVRTFDSEIDTDLDGGEKGADESAAEEPSAEETPVDRAAEAEDTPSEGLGKHYA